MAPLSADVKAALIAAEHQRDTDDSGEPPSSKHRSDKRHQRTSDGASRPKRAYDFDRRRGRHGVSSSGRSFQQAVARHQSPSGRSDEYQSPVERAERRVARAFQRRVLLHAQRAVAQSPLERIPQRPLDMQVVMAPGDASPRIAGKRALVEEAQLQQLTQDARVLLAEIDSARYPLLSPVARLAPGLDQSIHVRGVLRVGEQLTPQERARDDNASPMLQRSQTGDLPSVVKSVADASSSAAATAAASASIAASSVAATAASASDLLEWSAGFATRYEHIVHPDLVDLSPLPGHGFVTSSRDALLLRLAREQSCAVSGSTSSTTRILAHLIYSLGAFHHIRSEGILMSDYEAMPKRPTSAERSPATLFFRKRTEGAEAVKDVESSAEENAIRFKYRLDQSSTSYDPDAPLLFDVLPKVWAIDSAPAWSQPANRILQELGHTMEAAFTHSPHEFTRRFMQKAGGKQKQKSANPKAAANTVAVSTPDDAASSSFSNPPADPSPPQAVRDAFLFIQMGSVMFRSQLDCWAPELVDRKELQSFLHAPASALSASSSTPTLPSWPGWELGGLVFDLKTRATLPIRLFCRRYSDLLDYQLLYDRGLLYSFEREYFDMQRAAFLKYSLQARIGRMGGVLIGYHNTTRAYGFHFVSVKEMDEALFGHTLIGEFMFEQSVKIMNKHIAGAGAEGQGILDIVQRQHARNWAQRKRIRRQIIEDKAKDKLKDARARKGDPAEMPTIAPEVAEEVPDAPSTLATDPLDDDDLSPPPPLESLKFVIQAQTSSPDLVYIFVETLPIETLSRTEMLQGVGLDSCVDPEASKPFLERYTSQRRIDSLPNYIVRDLLRQKHLDSTGNRSAIVSRLEGALSLKPKEQLPDPEVFLELARMNCIHKFVIRVAVSDNTRSSAKKNAGAPATGDVWARDSEGQSIIHPDDMSDVLERWSAEYNLADMDAVQAAMPKEARLALDAAALAGQALGEDVDAPPERSAGPRCPPVSHASLREAPSTRVSVSSSLTHFSVLDGTIDAADLAAEYRTALHFSSKVSDDDTSEENDGDMVDALRISMQGLVASQARTQYHMTLRAQRKREKLQAMEAARKLQSMEEETEKDTSDESSATEPAANLNATLTHKLASLDTAAAAASAPSPASASLIQRNRPLSAQETEAWRMLRTAIQRSRDKVSTTDAVTQLRPTSTRPHT